MMRRLTFFLLLYISGHVFAKDPELPPVTITPVQISQMYDSKNSIAPEGLFDLVDREEKTGICIAVYVEKQAKSYSKSSQVNLYDMIHNFGKIVSRIYGGKIEKDNIPHGTKVETLARVQCEAYYALGVLK